MAIRIIESGNQDVYSTENPPRTRTEAETRIEELRTKVIRIQTQLDHLKPGDVEGNYNVWKRRAVAALAHAKKEAAFIKRWIFDNFEAEEWRTDTEEGGPELAAFIERCRTECDEFMRRWPQRFSETHPLTSVESGLAREEELTLFEPEAQGLCQKQTEERSQLLTQFPELQFDFKSLRRPLTDHIKQIQAERVFVKRWLKRHSTSKTGTIKPRVPPAPHQPITAPTPRLGKGNRGYYTRILLSVIDRATAQGIDLRLTPDEMTAIGEIRIRQSQDPQP